MSQKKLRIGTRDSQLAVWQATLVQNLLKENGVESELVYIKSEGDIDTVTPLYELGVQGVFTKSLDAALLDQRIDIAVHSMKDVPTQLAKGIIQAAVLKRANHKDLFVPHPHLQDVESIFGRGRIEIHRVTWTTGGSREKKDVKVHFEETGEKVHAVVATSSVRRIAQWKHRFPHHSIENLRGNVNTRLKKLQESNWHGAIFAAAGLERIGLRPDNAIELDWMLPAPAQGAIMVVCREDDTQSFNTLQSFNDPDTALCTKIERDFLRTLMGGCSTPISILAEVKGEEIHYNYNLTAIDGRALGGGNGTFPLARKGVADIGIKAAEAILKKNGRQIIEQMRKTGPAT
jgi:hydroxymethylbilane synthase